MKNSKCAAARRRGRLADLGSRLVALCCCVDVFEIVKARVWQCLARAAGVSACAVAIVTITVLILAILHRRARMEAHQPPFQSPPDERKRA